MEKRHCHGKHPPPLAPPRRGRGERKQGAGASFSASLLDAIYRSLDEGSGGDGVGVVDTTRRSEEKAKAPPQFWWAKEAAKPKLAAGADRRRCEIAVARPRHSGYASSATSSSDSSSSYSFSCSSASTTDTESTHRRHSPPPPLQPEAVDADAAESAAPPNCNAKKKGRPCFPGARLRPRGAAPSSPGQLPPSPATFACVLKTLFTSVRLPRKPKTPTAVPPPQITSPVLPQPSCASVTSTAKAADVTKAAERRSVRFCPDAEASVVRRRVEELVRSLGDEEEGSDSSSDLFELESLRGADGDELPVYGTTNLAANRVIAQGAVC